MFDYHRLVGLQCIFLKHHDVMVETVSLAFFADTPPHQPQCSSIPANLVENTVRFLHGFFNGASPTPDGKAVIRILGSGDDLDFLLPVELCPGGSRLLMLACRCLLAIG